MTNNPQLSTRQQKTRFAFMDALLRLVIERGLDRITVTDIANEAHYGRWTFYHYFESKEAVVWATFEYWMTHLDQHLTNTFTHLPSPMREYQSWRMIFFAFWQQRQFLLRISSVIGWEWRLRAKEYLIQQFLQHLDDGHYLLMEGVRPEIAARLYVVSLMELLEYWGQNPDIGDLDTMVDEYFVFIFRQNPPST